MQSASRSCWSFIVCSLVLISAVNYLMGCMKGGGGGSVTLNRFAEEIEARFINAPVKGLRVKRSLGGETVTGDDGIFRCFLAEEVTFYLGGLFLGSSSCGDYIFLVSLVNSRGLAGWSHSKVASLIQTFSVSDPLTGPLRQLNIQIADQALTEISHPDWVVGLYNQNDFNTRVTTVLTAAKGSDAATGKSSFQARAFVNPDDALLNATDRWREKVQELNNALPAVTRASLAAIAATNPGDIVARASLIAGSCSNCQQEYVFDLNFKTIRFGSKDLFQIEGFTSPETLGDQSIDGSETAAPVLAANASTSVRVSETETMNFYLWLNNLGRPQGVATLVQRDGSGEIATTGRYLVEVNADEDGSEPSTVGASPVRPSGTPQSFQRLGATLPVPLQLASTIQIGSKVYLIGGESDTAVTDKIYEATISENGSIGAFTESAFSITTARKGARVERIGNHVYLIGGYTALDAYQGPPLDSIERATCNDNGLTSHFTTDSVVLDRGRYNFLTLVTPGYIYALGGGILGSFHSNSISRAPINTSTGRISGNFVELTREVISASEVKNGLVDDRWTHNGIRIGNNFYILGGEGLDTIERVKIFRDGSIGNFVKLSNTLNSSRNRLSVVALNEKVYVFGGWNGSFLTTVESAPIVGTQLGAFKVESITLADGVESGVSLLTNSAIFLFGGATNIAPFEKNFIQRAVIQND